jgi:SAM-dependent methyltransferase
MSRNSSYIVQVGEAGRYRLDILNTVFGPQSQRFLRRAGLKEGMHVLDVGCGTGNMSLIIAELVGNTGNVTGIDISEEQLVVAREKAKEKNITNIDFQQLSEEDIFSLRKKYDFIYCRFVLMHLAAPQKTLRNLYLSLNPGGILATEEPTMSSCFSVPSSGAFKRSIEILMDCANRLNLNFDVGDNLFEMYRAIGCADVDIHIELAQQIVTQNPEKRLMEFLIVEAAPKYIANDVSTQEEINHIAKEMKTLTDQPASYIGSCRQTQVWASFPTAKL